MQVTGAVALAVAHGELGVGLGGVALLALAGLVAQVLLALLGRRLAPRALPRKDARELVAELCLERLPLRYARASLLATHVTPVLACHEVYVFGMIGRS